MTELELSVVEVKPGRKNCTVTLEAADSSAFHGTQARAYADQAAHEAVPSCRGLSNFPRPFPVDEDGQPITDLKQTGRIKTWRAVYEFAMGPV